MSIIANPKPNPNTYYRFVKCPESVEEERHPEAAKLYKNTPKQMKTKTLLSLLLVCDPLPDDVTIQRFDAILNHWVWCNGAEIITLLLAADDSAFNW